MTLNSVHLDRYPGLYNHELLDWRRQRAGLSSRQVAQAIGLPETTVLEVFRGLKSNARKIYPVVRYLGLNWAMVHDLTLPEGNYDLAIESAVGAQVIAPNGSP